MLGSDQKGVRQVPLLRYLFAEDSLYISISDKGFKYLKTLGIEDEQRSICMSAYVLWSSSTIHLGNHA